MPRADPILTRIRRCLAHGAAAEPPAAQQAAHDYVVLVEEVNARLQRCVDLLRRGMRSEAVHQAEIAPPLLDEAAALDFPQLEAWVAYCAERGLGPVPAVDVDAAVELDEAYPRERQLARLLRAHRRLALGRAPLRDRIKVLRRLTQADVENAVWGEDLIEFERARHGQIREEAEAARQKRDLRGLEALDGECRETWLEAPAAGLCDGVHALTMRTRRELAVERMAALIEGIQEAHGAGEEEMLRRLLVQWHKAVSDAGDTGGRPVPGVRSAIAWLVQRDEQRECEVRFAAASRELEQALDDRAAVVDLERLWATVRKYDLPIAAPLRQRYEARLTEHRIDAARRFRLKVAAVCAVLIVVGGAVAYVVQWQVTARRVAHWGDAIGSLTQEDRLDDAAVLLDQLRAEHPRLWERPAIQALSRDVDARQAEERTRRERFAAAVQQVTAAGLDQPDTEALDRAAKLAVADEEKRQVEAIRDRISRAELRQQRENSEAFRLSVADMRRRFVELAKPSPGPPDKAVQPLERLRSELRRLLDMKGIRPAIRSSAQPLLSQINVRLEALQEEIERPIIMQEAVDRIRTLDSRPGVLAEELASFARLHPNAPLAAEFGRAAPAAAVGESVVAWASRFNRAEVVRIRDREIIDAMGAFLDGFEQKHAAHPYLHAVAAYRTYLARASAALDPQRAPDHADGDLHRLLTHAFVDGLHVLEARDGRRFYSTSATAPVDWGADHVNVRCVVNPEQVFGREDPRQFQMPRSAFGADLTPRPAPQGRFVTEAWAWLRANAGDWENAYLHLCRILMGHQDMDPVLQAMLAQDLVRLSRERDWCDAPELARWAARLDRVDIDANWLDPDDHAAKRARTFASDMLKQRPDLDALLVRFVRWRLELAPRRPLGMLWRGPDGAVTPSRSLVGFPDGPLDVVAREKDGPWQFRAVGDLVKGEVRWQEPRALPPAGTILYRCEPIGDR